MDCVKEHLGKSGKKLFGLCGPPASGKRSVQQKLQELCPGIFFVPRFTTRPPKSEQDADVCVTREEFAAAVRQGRVVARTASNRHNYGIRIEDLEKAAGSDCFWIGFVGSTTCVAIQELFFPRAMELFFLEVDPCHLRRRLWTGKSDGSDDEDVSVHRYMQSLDPWKIFATHVVPNPDGQLDEVVESIARHLGLSVSVLV